MTFESEMMAWLLLLIFVWALICCIWEDFENRNLINEYHNSFEYQRNFYKESMEEEA